MAVFWCIAAAAFLVVEIATTALVSLWFIGGSLAALLVALCGGQLWLQIVLFVVISAGLLALLRPLMRRPEHSEKNRTNADRLLGRDAVVTEEICDLRGTGAVRVSGAEWSARTGNDSVIPADSVVEIYEIRGVCLYVRKKQ